MKSTDRSTFQKTHLIIGPGVFVPIDNIENYIIHGDRRQQVQLDKLNLEPNAHVMIYAHGMHIDSSHFIQLYSPSFEDGVSSTASSFEALGKSTQGKPVNVELFSCYGGYAKNDLEHLPQGSTLMTFINGDSTTERYTLRRLTDKSSEFLKDNPFIRFSSFLLLNANDNSFGINTKNGPQTINFSLDSINDFSDQGIKNWQNERIKEFSVFLEKIKNDLDDSCQERISQFITLVKNEEQRNKFINSVDIKEYKRALLENLIEKDQTSSIQTYLENNNNPFIDILHNDIEAEKMGGRKHPLFALLSKGDFITLESLIASGANANQKDAYGFTIIQRATESNLVGNLKFIEFLLTHGANPNEEGYGGGPPLIEAAQAGNVKIAGLLLTHGANPNQKDMLDRTSLQSAVGKGNKEMTKLLLAHNADINQAGIFGRTPIHEAIHTENLEMLILLLDNGDDLLQKDEYDRALSRALSYAKELGNQEIIDAITTRVECENHNNIEQKRFSIMETASNIFAQLNEAIKQYDPLQILRGAEAATVNDHSEVMIASTTPPAPKTITNALPTIADKSQTTETHVAQSYDERFADTINQRIFIGTAALAMTMKALGQNTDWAKPILGIDNKLEMNFDPKILVSNMNPEYDYLAKIEQTAKNAQPLQKAVLKRITELAKSGEVASWTKEQWQNFAKDDKKLKVFLEVAIEEAKIRKANSRPLTNADFQSTNKSTKIKETRRRS